MSPLPCDLEKELWDHVETKAGWPDHLRGSHLYRGYDGRLLLDMDRRTPDGSFILPASGLPAFQSKAVDIGDRNAVRSPTREQTVTLRCTLIHSSADGDGTRRVFDQDLEAILEQFRSPDLIRPGWSDALHTVSFEPGGFLSLSSPESLQALFWVWECELTLRGKTRAIG